MNRGRFTAIIPALAASAVALGVTASTATAAATQPAASHAAVSAAGPAKTVVFDCSRGEVRPRTVVLTCGDGNDYLTNLSWKTWSSALASGTGTNMINGCVPYCAAGKFHSYPSDVVFWRSEPVPHHPKERYFTRVTVLYPGARPPAYWRGKEDTGPETWTGTLAG